MVHHVDQAARTELPSLSASVELLKPITWFPPMWAFACGVVSSGVSVLENWNLLVLGVLLAGPLVCGMSQAVNDWFDRHVDAINEPHRPIPSGRVPGRWGLYIAIIWTVLSLIVALTLGIWVFIAACVGCLLAWAYSAPPARLKRNGWWGNAAVGGCYEGLPWFTGAAAMAAALPETNVLYVCLLYSIGAHGIMTLNDFKAMDGDRALGIRSLPVMLGAASAARLACWLMAVPQAAVVLLLFLLGLEVYAMIVLTSLAAQMVLMRRLLRDPRALAPWYNATGVTLFVSGMMVTAVALRTSVGGI